MILITTQTFPPDRGGMETLMGGLADALYASGQPIAVFADRIHSSGLAEREGVPYPIRRFSSVRPLRRRTKALAVAEAARANDAKGLFADSWKSIELLPPFAIPIAVLAHGMEFPAAPSASKRARIARSLKRARVVIANSRFTASLVEPYMGGAHRLTVINPPIERQPEPSARGLSDVRRMISGHGPVLLTVARLEPRKGIDMVIRAMRDARRAYPEALYIVAGGGEDRGRLEQIAADNGVADCVIFVGPVDGDIKAGLFASCDVFAMPTRREGNSVEGFGIVYIEAGWYGVPSIAGREGGAPDAVIDGQTGLLCNATNLADVTRQIMRLLDDDRLRRHLSAAAERRARGELQWAHALPRFLAALR